MTKGHIRKAAFFAGGAIFGLGYYRLFGCTGGCPITSNPFITMGYMGMMGVLLAGVTEVKKGE